MTLFILIRDFFFTLGQYREYLIQSVARDLRKQYKRSFLGYLWSMLNPLFMMIILAVVFSNIMRQNIEDYAIFLFTGMLPWAYFEGTLLGCLGTIRNNAQIFGQVPVPKFIFPMSVALFNFVTFALSLVPLLLVMVVLGRPVPATIALLPMVLLPLFFVSMGAALAAAVANVFFEDTQHLVGVVLRALYFLCPILYSKDLLPPELVKWLAINPMFQIIEFSRDIFYYGVVPDMLAYGITLGSSLAVLLVGLWTFKQADEKLLYFI